MRGFQRFRFVFFAASSLALFAVPAWAATLIVDPNGPGDFTTIQPAIDAAQPGDMVLVKAGEYVITEPISFKGKAITVRSESGAEATTIRMSDTPADPHRASVVVFESGETIVTSLDGFKLTNGKTAGGGGGVACSGSSPTLNNCTISRNSAVIGGGMSCSNASSPILSNCTISWNGGGYGGGVNCNGNSSPVLTNCTISWNGGGYGGGVNCNGNSSPVLTNCTISGNSANDGGGVSCSDASSPSLTNCVISGNSVPNISAVVHPSGGGVFCGPSSSPTFTNCTISSNSAVPGWRCNPAKGGGIYCAEASSSTLNNCTINGNLATMGGGVFSECASPTITNCTISGNLVEGCFQTKGSGGGVFSSGSPPTLTNCIIWDNVGGVIEGDNNPLVSYSCVESADVWPGIGNIQMDPQFCGWNAADMWVDTNHPRPGTGTQADPFLSLSLALGAYDLGLKQSSPCRGNGTDGADMGAALGPCQGDGSTSVVVHLAPGTYPIAGFSLVHKVSIEGSGREATVIEGTIYGLRTGRVLSGLTVTGGGVVVSAGEAPEIRDCAISGNNDYGVVCNSSSPTLTNCTISGSRGAGMSLLNSSSPTLKNCIVAYNDSGPIGKDESSNAIVSYSCIEGGWPGDGNIDQDPSFVEPGWWGNSPGTGALTWIPGDYHLQPGSPCIDTGTCEGAPPLDIEGNVRPSGAGCDMGAYEFGSAPPPPPPHFRRGDTNGDAKTDMSDAITTLGFLFLGRPETLACEMSADTNDDGKIDLSDPVALLNHLFLGAPAPPTPFGDCGVDPTEDTLTCEGGGPCA